MSNVDIAYCSRGLELLRIRVAASLSAAYDGAAMLAYPDRAGATEGHLWGVAMVLWGTLVALVPSPSDPAGR